ncbi:MAG TPA: adenylyltransferase/cytidyltransferase family protein [Candidatus Paceibacterota bacterium]|nr:adenylyltransferase/cytidyltransferase family protein [Candidatus Paceibacterota bacterium]
MKNKNALRILQHGTKFQDRFIPNWKDLCELVVFYRSQGLRIVLTGGSWDLPHIGHTRYLQKASELGDVLIVGVDSDRLIKERKEPGRPAQGQDERMEHISELRPVNIVTLYDVGKGKGGEALVRLIKPDVLVMSKSTGDKTHKQFARYWQRQYKNICKVVVLEPQAITSTSNIYRQLNLNGLKGAQPILDKWIGRIEECVEGMRNDLSALYSGQSPGSLLVGNNEAKGKLSNKKVVSAKKRKVVKHAK